MTIAGMQLEISETQITKGNDSFASHFQPRQVFSPQQIVQRTTKNICLPLFTAHPDDAGIQRDNIRGESEAP